jgi:2-oxoisovalerate dehydrogenase E1 component alpha subunit
MIQLLTPEGELVESAPQQYRDIAASLTDDELRGFYRDLVLTRRFDAEATALQRQGELGLWASLLGQEAAQVGSGRALRPQDYAFPTYREHGVAWCRGVDPVNLMGMFRGVNHGGWDPNDKNFHLYTIIIGAQTLHATGYAMGVQRDGAVGTGDPDRDTAVIAYFGDGATSQGDVSEALVFAGVNNSAGRLLLPEQPVGDLRAQRKADARTASTTARKGFGFPGTRVDGNDVLATYAVTKVALDAARDGGGAGVSSRPSPIGWARTRPPTTRPSTGSPPRSSVWKLRDPIERFKAGWPTKARRTGRSSTRSPRRPMTSAPTCARAASPCRTRARHDMFEYVYAEDHPVMVAEREPSSRHTSRALRGLTRRMARLAQN